MAREPLIVDPKLPARPPSYSCGGVFFWINHLWMPTPGVQISQRSINDSMAKHYSNGPPFQLPHELHAVAAGPDGSITRHRGALRTVSPIELGRTAFIKLAEAHASFHSFQLRERYA